MSEKVKMVASLQNQVSRMEDSAKEVQAHLSTLTAKLKEEQDKVQAAQEEAHLLRSKLDRMPLSFVFCYILEFWWYGECLFNTSFIYI